MNQKKRPFLHSSKDSFNYESLKNIKKIIERELKREYDLDIDLDYDSISLEIEDVGYYEERNVIKAQVLFDEEPEEICQARLNKMEK